MVSLKLQKRLAASVFECGKRKVWLDPNENSAIHNAHSRAHIRKLIKDGYANFFFLLLSYSIRFDKQGEHIASLQFHPEFVRYKTSA